MNRRTFIKGALAALALAKVGPISALVDLAPGPEAAVVSSVDQWRFTTGCEATRKAWAREFARQLKQESYLEKFMHGDDALIVVKGEIGVVNKCRIITGGDHVQDEPPHT